MLIYSEEPQGEAGVEEEEVASPLPLLVVFGVGIGLIVFLLLFLYVLPSQPVHVEEVLMENSSINIVRLPNGNYTVYMVFTVYNNMEKRDIMVNRIIIDDKDYMVESNNVPPKSSRSFNITLIKNTRSPPKWGSEKKVVLEYIYLDNGEIKTAEFTVPVVSRG